MSEVLGHDINGKPIRAGDKVRLVGDVIAPSSKGIVSVVFGPWNFPPTFPPPAGITIDGPWVQIEEGQAVPADSCQRIDDSLRPAGQSFEQMMASLGGKVVTA